MPIPPRPPRKRRTRQHVIADLCVNHVERCILESGHTCQIVTKDYGYDATMRTFDEQGYAEEGFVCFQLKATDSLSHVAANFMYDVDIRDYNLWITEKMPVILILYDASARRAYWVAVQKHFSDPRSRFPRTGAKTVRVPLPKRQVLNQRAIATFRELKAQPWLRIARGLP